MSIEPFQAAIDGAILDDLKQRLELTRWPDALEGQGWSLGADLGFVQRLCMHWQTRFDWRAAEARLNTFNQHRATIDGIGIHLIHEKSPQPDSIPLLMMNGWPSSIFEYVDIIPRLRDSGFHVVAPALPGYGFSDRPRERGMNASRIAELYPKLMSELGYERFIAHGSDLGAGVAERLRRSNPERLRGVHFCNVYWGYPPPEQPTPEEEEYLKRVQGWQFAEGAYAMMHATKPQTLAYGLNDSPAGLAAWIVEKFQAWSDGDAETVFGLDGLCANLTLYWATQTINSSCRLYAEAFGDRAAQSPPEKGAVPTGVIVFPKDILPAPRAWGERWLNLVHWTETPRGGHFCAWEAPDILAEDLKAFAAKLRQ